MKKAVGKEMEEDKSPFVNDVTHVAYGQELGSTGLQDEFQGIHNYH